MDLELGHGFIPRVGEENYKAVDRCVGPADLFNPDPLGPPVAAGPVRETPRETPFRDPRSAKSMRRTI